MGTVAAAPVKVCVILNKSVLKQISFSGYSCIKSGHLLENAFACFFPSKILKLSGGNQGEL